LSSVAAQASERIRQRAGPVARNIPLHRGEAGCPASSDLKRRRHIRKRGCQHANFPAERRPATQRSTRAVTLSTTRSGSGYVRGIDRALARRRRRSDGERAGAPQLRSVRASSPATVRRGRRPARRVLRRDRLPLRGPNRLAGRPARQCRTRAAGSRPGRARAGRPRWRAPAAHGGLVRDSQCW
jgi:hypothetical protein